MRLFILFLLCSISLNLFAQNNPEPAGFVGFTSETVKFNSAGVTLAGTIFKPENPQAALVLVHGSGQEKRSLEWASLLAKNDIAVITYDKRGVGESGGVYAGPEVGTNNIDSANLNLLALDASAASGELLKHLQNKRTPMGLMGASQAGWIIPIAAKLNSRFNFMVIFSGPVITTLEQLRFQFYTAGNTKFWDTHSEAEAREHIRTDSDKYQFAATDPIKTLSALSVPGLWIYGGKDIQIPSNLCIEHLQALKQQGKPYEYRLFPDLGHNTAFSKSKEPMGVAIEWLKAKARRKNK